MDWVLVVALVPTAIVETILRDDLVWPVVTVIVASGAALLLLWRRTHPLAAVVGSFGTTAVVELATLVAGEDAIGLNTMLFFLVFPYALFRWGSGREAAIGLAVMFSPHVVSTLGYYNGLGDAVTGFLILTASSALGAAVRYQASATRSAIEQVKLREREQLARELHDTVAHHISAIAIQAQAGRAVGTSHPDSAMEALGVIEEEASRTLAEMRAMVGALRHGEEPDLLPQRGVADIARLAGHSGDSPRIEVELSGDLDNLRPSVGAAIYRLAQESITNARRHARHASRISVRVVGGDQQVSLSVSDDGEPQSFTGSSVGYGLIGMTERALLLGGKLQAGPAGDRGWTVDAIFPRSGPTS